MINTLKITQFKNAIRNYDSNYIKNLYLYNKDLYFELCKQIAIIQAFCKAQSRAQKKFNDKKLNFWKTIYYINSLECSEEQVVFSGVELRFLPKVYLTIINEINMDTNKSEYLKQHTPLWRTWNSCCVFSILTLCLSSSLFAVYRLNDNNQIQNLARELYNVALNIWSDTYKFNVFINVATLLTSVSVFYFVAKKDYTKEYCCNFFDWSAYQYRFLFNKTKLENTKNEPETNSLG